MEAPVSNHAPVAVGSAHSRFADAVSVGGVAGGAVNVEGQGPQRVTVARWGFTKDIRGIITSGIKSKYFMETVEERHCTLIF